MVVNVSTSSNNFIVACWAKQKSHDYKNPVSAMLSGMFIRQPEVF